MKEIVNRDFYSLRQNIPSVEKKKKTDSVNIK